VLLLAAVLLGVIIFQVARTKSKAPAPTAEAPVPAQPNIVESPVPDIDSQVLLAQLEEEITWTRPRTAEAELVIERDPLVLTDALKPEPEPAPASDMSQAQVKPDQSIKPATGLTLKGILGEPGNRMALINGRVVGRGETLEGYTIETIDEQEILLIKNDQHYRLTMGD
jgi:hypothetical protein